MFTFEPSTDLLLVKAIMTHPVLYAEMMDDFSPTPEAFTAPLSEALRYVLVKRRGALLGVVLIVRRSTIVCEVHICILPKFWGRATVAAGRQFLSWLWANTPYLRAIGNMPSFNRSALALAEELGFKAWGRNKGSFMKHAMRHDEIYVGIDRPEHAF